jgi:hypothetical protein
MASSTKFSETFSLLSLNQHDNQPREKVSLLLLLFQPIIWSIKINKNLFLKEEKISFRKLIFYKLKKNLGIPQKKKEHEMDETM